MASVANVTKKGRGQEAGFSARLSFDKLNSRAHAEVLSKDALGSLPSAFDLLPPSNPSSVNRDRYR
jgi:hypothetical protein